MFMGTGCAITLDLPLGVYNTKIKDNTIVNRDGAVHILNGDAVRITNNQIELGQGQGDSESPVSAMIWVEGVDRICNNIVIEENNLGGGTSLDHLIYIDNAYKAVITKNQMISVNVAELYLTANSKYCNFRPDNTVLGSVSNPRTRTLFKANVVDLGVGNMGTLKSKSRLSLQNGWDTVENCYFKDEYGYIHFIAGFSAGTPAANTVICTLPVGDRPLNWANVVCVSDAGIGVITTQTDGVIKVFSIANNSQVFIQPFLAATTE
jgi:hypothetical protein